jgi:hypothetical protein
MLLLSKEGGMRGERVRGLAESHKLVKRIQIRGSLRSIAFLKTKEFSGWNIIDDFMLKTS